MATFVTLWNWTDQGLKNVRATVERADAFKQAAETMGVKVHTFYWTVGQYDGICVLDAPDDATAVAAMLKLVGHGNIRTQTLHAYAAREMSAILAKAGT